MGALHLRECAHALAEELKKPLITLKEILFRPFGEKVGAFLRNNAKIFPTQRYIRHQLLFPVHINQRGEKQDIAMRPCISSTSAI